MTTINRTVYGIGYNSDGVYKKQIKGKKTKAYINWQSMLRRCYSKMKSINYPSYNLCTVSEEWHDFQNFAKWHEDNYIEGFHLDKDLKNTGNTIYSPSNCLYVPRQINQFLVNRDNDRGPYKQGVSLNPNGKFYAHIRRFGTKEHIGCFTTEEEAYQAYLVAKKKYAKDLAETYKNTCSNEVYQQLMKLSK